LAFECLAVAARFGLKFSTRAVAEPSADAISETIVVVFFAITPLHFTSAYPQTPAKMFLWCPFAIQYRSQMLFRGNSNRGGILRATSNSPSAWAMRFTKCIQLSILPGEMP